MWRWILGFFAAILLLVAAYVGYVLLRYTDIPAETMLEKYQAGQMQLAMVDGQPLYYQDQGQGQPIVLLHSHFFTQNMWDAWAQPLSQHYRVIRYDLTSHGLTGPALDNDYSTARDVALLHGLLQQLNIDKAVLVGSSLGGNIAIAFTALYPEKVASLVLQNSGGFRKADSRGGRGQDLPGWADYLLYLLPKMGFDAFLEWMVYDKHQLTAQIKDDFHNAFRRSGNRAAEMQRIRQFQEGGAAPQLEQITAPVLIQWGENNPQLPVALTASFEQHLTKSVRVETRIYPKTGHVLALEQPAQSLQDLLNFLQQEPRSE
jgi:pimeloyl-ACP methyl ester carboxylesterase